MKDFDEIVLDDGYRFGMGAFETISVKKGKAILLPYHIERLGNALDTLRIPMPRDFEEKMAFYVHQMDGSKEVLRVAVSMNNTVWETRKNLYTKEQYARGFSLIPSTVRRNETSLLTGIKSLNQGDNVLQRRMAMEKGFDEAVFLNSREEFTEGTFSNLFFVADKRIYTPAANCGLLEGTIRRWLIRMCDIEETCIHKDDLDSFQEVFITNSVLGVMPVAQFGNLKFPERTVTNELMDLYQNIELYEKDV